MRVRSAFLTALVIVFGVSGATITQAETIVPFTNSQGEPDSGADHQRDRTGRRQHCDRLHG